MVTSMESVRFWCAILMSLMSIKFVFGGGTMSLRLIHYVNPGGMGNNGHCCDGRMGICLSPCDHVFIICLDHAHRHTPNDRVCPHGRIQTGPVYNADSIIFDASIGGTQNPMQVKFSEWPGGLFFKIKIYDHDNIGRWDYVDTLQQLVSQEASPTSSLATEKRIYLLGRTKLAIGLRIYCDYGFYGDKCSTYCLPRNSNSGHYECSLIGDKICHPGWTGFSCELSIDECSPEPCLNGGRCQDLHNGYECTCPAGFIGSVCQTNIDECASAPCRNEGVCVDQRNAFTCVCDAGYEGPTCAEAVDPCKMAHCDNNATCRMLNATNYECLCLPGFFGDNCDFVEPESTTVSPKSTTVAPQSTTVSPPSTTVFPTEETTSPRVVTRKPRIAHNPNGPEKSDKSSFTTSVRVMVEGKLSEEQMNALKVWIARRLAEYEKINNETIHIGIRDTPCTGDKGSAVTELVILITYDVGSLTPDEMDFSVRYLSRFVQSSSFLYPLYRGMICTTGLVSARVTEQAWILSNWIIVAIAGTAFLLFVIIVVFFVRRRRSRPRLASRAPIAESYEWISENQYETTDSPIILLGPDLPPRYSPITVAFHNGIYEESNTSLPGEDPANRDSAFDEEEYNADNNSEIYASID